MKKRIWFMSKFISLFVALVFCVQTTAVNRLSYLAPGQIVGGLPYDEIELEQFSPEAVQLQVFNAGEKIVQSGTLSLFAKFVIGMLLMCSLLFGQEKKAKTVELKFGAMGIDFYGYTQGVSKSTDQFILLKRNVQSSDNWGNAFVQVKSVFEELVNEIGFENIQSIQFEVSGNGNIKVWLKTVQDQESGNHMPYIGGQSYSVSSKKTIVIPAELLLKTKGKGGLQGIIVDLLSGSVELSGFKIQTTASVTISSTQTPQGPIEVYPPGEVEGEQVKIGEKIGAAIEALKVTLPKIDDKTDVNWMKKNQHPTTGLVKDTEAHTMSQTAYSSWSYVQGTALMRFVEEGELDAARKLASGLIKVQNRNGKLRGSWARGWWWHNGEPIDIDSGVGETAWIAFGFFHLYVATGESKWLEPLYEATHFIAEGQALDKSNQRVLGSVHRSYDKQGNLHNWRSIEHNIDAASLFYKVAHLDLSQNDVDSLKKKGVFHSRMELFARARLVVDWMVKSASKGGMWTGERFHIGYDDLNGNSFSSFDEPTDPQTWGLLVLKALDEIHPNDIQEYGSALNWILAYMKVVSWNKLQAYGFSRKPYSDAPSVSSEFTYGYALAAHVLQRTMLYRFFTAETWKLKDTNSIALSIIGPKDKGWPFHEPYGHMTAANWAAWAGEGTNPFEVPTDIPGFKRHANVNYLATYPEEATLQAAIRQLLSPEGSSTDDKKKEKDKKKKRRGGDHRKHHKDSDKKFGYLAPIEEQSVEVAI